MQLVLPRLVIPHCYWKKFEQRCKQIPNRDEWYIVEQLESGLWLCIQKNGRSGKNIRSGGKFPHDFILTLYDGTHQEFIWQPSYISPDVRGYAGLIPDLYNKLLTHEREATQLIDTLLWVARGGEPTNINLKKFRHLTGRPIDEILLIFKWLLAQEGVNYPIEQGKSGRLYPLYRIQEMCDGVPIEEVLARCQATGMALANINGVNYQRIDHIILQ